MVDTYIIDLLIIGLLLLFVTFIVVSVIVHGISSTPLMNWYERNLSHHQNSSSPATIDEFE